MKTEPNHRLPASFALGLVLGATCLPARPAPSNPTPAVPVVWDSPSADSWGSMPIGNGDIGANVWIEPSGELVLLLSKSDAWSGNGRLLKLGRVRIQLPSVEGFRQELRLLDGDIVIHGGATTTRVWIDANHPVLRVEMDGNEPFVTAVKHETWRTGARELRGSELHSAYGLLDSTKGRNQPHRPVIVEPDTVIDTPQDRIVFFHHNTRSVWQENLRLQALGAMATADRDPLMHRTFGAIVRGDGLIHDAKDRLVAKQARRAFSIAIYPYTAITPKPGTWVEQATASAARVEGTPVTAARAAHAAWWRAFWQRSWIHVENPAAAAVNQGYLLQRWINACAGRGAHPIKFNGSLFNVDLVRQLGGKSGYDADYRLWGPDYWWQNTRLPYWSMLAAGDFDLMQPLFKQHMAALPLRKAATRAYYGHDGAFFPETMTFWGTYNNANYGWLREGKPDGLTDNIHIRYYWQGGLEMIMLMLDYYDHTGDADFLKQTLLPFADEIVTFFDRHWPRGSDGKIHFDPAMALETYRTATNPMPEIAGLSQTLPQLIALTSDADQKASWRKTLADLPPVPITKQDGKRWLLPAEKFSTKQNIENPELYAIFPYRHYGVGKPDLEVALETWRRRSHKGTGGWNQNPIKAARLGLADEARSLVGENFQQNCPGFRFPAMWGPNYDWVPDQDHGTVAMTALQSMLLQAEGEKILLLPAWPRDWDVTFKLHAPHQTTVQGEFRDGKIQNLNVTPQSRRKDIEIIGMK